MFTAFILMNLFRIPANLLSLGAIDFGIIVDGAIVMTEAILRRREADPNRPLTEGDVAAAAHQVARPILFATLIIIATYLPLFAFQRVEAKLFYPMAYAVGFAQFGALLHLLLVPGLALIAYRRPRRVFRNRVLERLEAGYRRMLQRSLRLPAIVFATTALAAVAVIALGTTASREFLPELDEGSIWLHAEMAGGISLAKAMEMDAGLARSSWIFPRSTMS